MASLHVVLRRTAESELYVRFLLRTEDVTKRVLSAARHAKTETERRVAVDSIMNVISMEVSRKSGFYIDWYCRCSLMQGMHPGYLFIVIIMMSAWFLHLLLLSGSSKRYG